MSIYSRLSALLTNYEDQVLSGDFYNKDNINWEGEFYEMLVEIQNNWDYITEAQG